MFAFSFASATTIYVSPDGVDSNTGSITSPLHTINSAAKMAKLGDTVMVLPGTYRNIGFGEGGTTVKPVAYISDLHGSAGNPIVFKSQVLHGAKLQFDGGGGLIFNNVSFIEINGFEIEGPGNTIDIDSARAHRLDETPPSLYTGRGIAFWSKKGNHHITVKNTKVHHCPNSGIRVDYGDYITFENNAVYSNCWWSRNAESGIVIAQATSIDSLDSIKTVIRNNRVWNNGNYVVYYNPNYGDGDGYGQPGYTRIVDGQGLYITRSDSTYSAGKFLIENNLSVNNGINGIGFHHSNRGIIRNNTLYKNGQFPERPVSGITINGADQVEVYNNIIVGRNDAVLQNYEASSNITLFNNLIWDGTNQFDSGAVSADPLFLNPTLDPQTANFSLRKNSPAINSGSELAPNIDIEGKERVDGHPDIGAWEFFTEVSVAINIAPSLPPNAISFQNDLLTVNSQSPVEIVIYTTNGRVVKRAKITEPHSMVETNFPVGVYVMKITGNDYVRSLRFVVK